MSVATRKTGRATLVYPSPSPRSDLYTLLELEKGLAVSLGVPPPHPWHMSGYGVSGVQRHPLSGVVSEDTEHSPELRDTVLRR